MLHGAAVSWTVHTTEKARHLVLRAPAGERLPAALTTLLRDEAVASGWLRGNGVLTNVELRAFDGQLGTLGSVRRVTGIVHLLALEGSIGLADGDPSFTLRAVLARETDRGLETIAGEITSATTVALEILVTALDDLTLVREVDDSSGLWMLAAPAGAPRAAPPKAAAAAPAWSSAAQVSDRVEREPARPRPSAQTTPAEPAGIPAPLPRPAIDFDVVYPDAGDLVEHFAFGSGEVVKSDGDRLHIKIHKDSRVREIALEMLKVSRLPDADDGRRRYRLERRL